MHQEPGFPPGHCLPGRPSGWVHGARRLVARLEGGTVAADAGAVLRGAARPIGLIGRLPAWFGDTGTDVDFSTVRPGSRLDGSLARGCALGRSGRLARAPYRGRAGRPAGTPPGSG